MLPRQLRYTTRLSKPAHAYSKGPPRITARRRPRQLAHDAPLRAELFSISQLERHAKTLAGWHELGKSSEPERLLPRLEDNEAVLADAYALVAEAVARGRQITPAAEWFIDNYHLIDEEIRTARRHLPRTYVRELPRIINGVKGTPRAYAIALELISHGHGRVDLEALRAFTVAYQSIQPLLLGELWAIPTMLRFALIEDLRRVIDAVTAGRRERERAGLWADKLLEASANDPSRVVLVLAKMIEEAPTLTNAFVTELAGRIQGRGAAMGFPIAWLDQRLVEKGQTLEQAFRLAGQSQAADQVSIGNCIGSLRFLRATDWRKFVEEASVVDRALRTDAAYSSMNFATRDLYRHAVEAIAKQSSRSQLDIALAATALAAETPEQRTGHVGYFLVDEGRPRLERAVSMRWTAGLLLRRVAQKLRLPLYVGSITLLALLLTAPFVLYALHARGQGNTAALVALVSAALICASQLATAMVHRAATLLVPPRVLPRLDFSEGIPAAHRTLVAVPAMLSSVATIDELVSALEIRFLANRQPHLAFALVTDFSDAATEHLPADAALLEYAVSAVEALRAKHEHNPGGGFFLLHRARRWNAGEGAWMGWERKRGKLEDLNATLRGARDRFERIVGSVEVLADVKYVIALDADTDLPRDAGRELAATLAHPLNRPVFDSSRGRITKGYGILQPRVGITLSSAHASRFAQLCAGESGIDPYTRAVSDVYQDVFDEGSFIGKGIYDVDAVELAIGGRFPNNRILSHDLLEGAYARSGLISDIILFEDFPSSYGVDASRRSRWIRGDWQIARWLFGGVPGRERRERNPVSLLSRWKILDNLRRSVVPAALVALFVLPRVVPGVGFLALVLASATLLVPNLLSALSAAARRPKEVPHGQHAKSIVLEVETQLARDVLALACLPYEALLGISSISRATLRVLITRRKLLEWRTASEAQRARRTGLLATYGAMWVLPASALCLALLRTDILLFLAPLVALWAIAPGLVWWTGRPPRARRAHLSAGDVRFLRDVARRTWRFFETYVGSEDNDLPPDNVQEDPPVGVAHRTSPTNIGMALLANLAAYDFGYVGAGAVMARTARTLTTMDRLERYRGHLYNWYDTRSLEPLRPMYVSTVDSGNLAGHLLTLAAGLEELAGHDVVRDEVLSGFADTLSIIEEEAKKLGRSINLTEIRERLAAAPKTATAWHELFTRVAASAALLPRVPGEELTAWIDALEAQATELSRELEHTLPWLPLGPTDRLAAITTLSALASMGGDVEHLSKLSGALREAVLLGAERATLRIAELQQLAGRCRKFADQDYDLLYDRSRQLFAIGYNVVDHHLDGSFYDLLASEARLASFVAIAQGKVPQAHWFALGRLLTTTSGSATLLSWSGSMFEYLMPLLVMPGYESTLLDATYRAVVDRQVEYGRERDVAWGVSESGYNKTDAQLNYQYRAFGVPGLGFKRGLAEDLVIAPYASALGLMVDPDAACKNLRRLESEQQLGGYGFYEAIDHTASRLPPGKTSVTVRSYMAHHQGMTFLSLAYQLLGQPMQRRFLSDPSLCATSLLLQERVPRTPAVYPHPAEVTEARSGAIEEKNDTLVIATPHTTSPEVHLLSNGRYHVAISNAGGGYSRWRDLAVTRWHEDPTRDCWGTFIYVRDVTASSFWSVAHQPTLRTPDTYEAIFSQGRAEFRRRDEAIETHVEISVSPEDDVELRRISLTNRSDKSRTLELTSYAEVVLTQSAADAAHRAFSNLFVQTELLREQGAILCTRRPRSGGETPPWMFHLMTVHGERASEASYETDRAAFLGRGRSAVDPAAMHQGKLGDSAGSVLDPCVAIRNSIELGADEMIQLHVVTGVAETRAGALSLIEKYTDRHVAGRLLELAWTQGQVLQRRLDVTAAEALLFGRLASHILYGNPAMRANASVIARNHLGQSGLWAYGISGDLPIVLVRIADGAHMELVRQMICAHQYWRLKGLAVDLVIWNEDRSGYRQDVHEAIGAAVARSGDAALLDRPGGIFVRRSDQMSDEDSVLTQTIARVIVSDSAGTLAEQVARRGFGEALALPAFNEAREPEERESEAPARVTERTDLAEWNGFGGFTKDGREYVISTTRGARTPLPWVNVLANPYFGTVVSESGGSYTWCENAHSYRLTPWGNDPISDASGEAFYLRDEDDGRYWSPTPQPCCGREPYTTRHGFGYTVFETTQTGLASELKIFVATDAPVKVLLFKLRNDSGRRRRVSLTGSFDLVLGSQRPTNLPHIVTEIDAKSGALFAKNPYAAEFAPRVAFLDCSASERAVTGDRGEIIGRNGHPSHPACMKSDRLSGRTGAGLDPCLAMQVTLDLAIGEEREVAFIFGSGRDLDDARHIVERFRGVGRAHDALERVWTYWNRTLGAVHVETPDPTLDFLANGWLVYQVLACRMWGRSGFYQSGGAYGFRDQLQDSMALLHAEPAILREQLLRAAAHQFRKGDVQHWWHPPLGRGVRTRISDDYLWLPYAVCRYVASRGDTGVLDEEIAFIEGRAVNPDEDSYYDLPTRAAESSSLYLHCVRAIEHGLRLGERGLPLMGTGDWNDGMNLVGDEGKGESVWLAFFLHDVLVQFATLARARGDGAYADQCLGNAAKLASSIERHGWDGEWYRRAYFDDGQPLGSSTSPECQIDALPQSWAVLANVGDRERALSGLAAVDKRLVDRELSVIKLFDPPFDRSSLEPGYVKGYVPGVRENGGQYTHAAVWTTMAFAAAGEIEKAWELFALINPVRHGRTSEIARYMVEPYVVAADVYTNPQHAGRGGWTWYTGSAGWMYRLVLESLLGLRLDVDKLHIEPRMPADWKGFKVHYRHGETVHHIHVERRGPGSAVTRVTSDGRERSDRTIPLHADRKEHRVVVEVGSA